ncbi:hypothetical protein [Methyloterricola oryzae]|uniref:hypothetical protein n=1 Tax=Methyloterricola oryzae TaxID=1495050 RepID=UPI0005EB7E68|nr:hypothetical protein [Methyloterricola oryzae]
MIFTKLNLTLLAGQSIPTPLPATFSNAVQSIEVTHTDEGRSGFQITFQAGREGLTGGLDYSLVASASLKPFCRVVVMLTLNAMPRVLFDGIITHQQLDPGTVPGGGLFTVTGEDVSVMMDLEEKVVEHPAQNEMMIATKIILSYAQYGLVPDVIPPKSLEIPLPVLRVPVQHATDREYLEIMARRFGYVFYVKPGPVPSVNIAHWGPKRPIGAAQRALSVNMGPLDNLESLKFEHDPLSMAFVRAHHQDSITNVSTPVQTFVPSQPPRSSMPTWLFHGGDLRRKRSMFPGASTAQAFARAQGETDASADVVSANGELDALIYGDILNAHEWVGVRGAGYAYDGNYYVKSVTHSIKPGAYKQRFTLTRDGVGSLFPAVRP